MILELRFMSDFKNHLYVVVLCGGGGTRVWPLSVSQKPKQFINFYSDKTLYQETVGRAKKLTSLDKILIMTNKDYVDEIKRQTPEIADSNIIAEPMKRNTAMAMGTIAAYVYKKDKDAVIINLASDAVIADKTRYTDTLNAAAKIAYEKKVLMSVGIKPTFAHPGLGYIHVGEEIEKADSLPLGKVLEFKEKPTVDVAQKFLDAGDYLWNANLYTWRADDILESFKRYSSEIYKSIDLISQAIGTNKENEVLKQQYQVVPEEQIDTAISEKADNLYVIPGDFGWNDVGGWKVVYELGDKDKNGNVAIKNSESKNNTTTLFEDASNNLVYSSGQTVAVLGLSNIVVVDTGNGLLVCDREKSNDVKKIVQTLKEKGFEDLT